MQLPPFEIEHFFRQHEFSAPYAISPSDCEPLTLPEILSYASPQRREQYENLWLGYTDSQGHVELRAAIAALHAGVSARHVLEVVPEEGIFVTMHGLLSAGDHVVAIHPSFQSLYEIARSIGCELSFWRAEATDDGWRFDIDALERLIRPDTKMLIVNFPHNPTGHLPSAADFRRIVELARRHGLILFSDEIYRFAERDESARLPSAPEVYERAVALGGLSKCFGLPGLRTGWLITRDADLMDKLWNIKSYTTICASAPGEFLSLIALENAAALTRRCMEIVRRNTEIAGQFFARHRAHFHMRQPDAGTICLVELNSDSDVSAFSDGALREAGLMILPAPVMQFDGNYFRLGLGRRGLPEALEALDAFVMEHMN